ncbi:MAG: hypothetical protein Q9201_006314 [Fulgogasparrea decipioides]
MPAIPDAQQTVTFDPDCPDPRPFQPAIPALNANEPSNTWGGGSNIPSTQPFQPAIPAISVSDPGTTWVSGSSQVGAGVISIGNSGPNIPAIVGGTVGGVAALALVVFLLYRWSKRRGWGFMETMREKFARKKGEDSYASDEGTLHG